MINGWARTFANHIETTFKTAGICKMETPKRDWNALHLKWLCIYFPGIVVESMWQQRLLKLSAERKAILGSRIMLVINGQNGWGRKCLYHMRWRRPPKTHNGITVRLIRNARMEELLLGRSYKKGSQRGRRSTETVGTLKTFCWKKTPKWLGSCKTLLNKSKLAGNGQN